MVYLKRFCDIYHTSPGPVRQQQKSPAQQPPAARGGSIQFGPFDGTHVLCVLEAGLNHTKHAFHERDHLRPSAGGKFELETKAINLRHVQFPFGFNQNSFFHE